MDQVKLDRGEIICSISDQEGGEMATSVFFTPQETIEVDLDEVVDESAAVAVLEALLMPFSRRRLAEGGVTLREIADRQGENALLFLRAYSKVR